MKQPPFNHLAREFGRNSKLAQQQVSLLYQALRRELETGGEETARQFARWQQTFRIVSGHEVGSHKQQPPYLKKFATGFGLDAAGLDAEHLVFVVHTYYALLVKLIALQALLPSHAKPGDSLDTLSQLAGGDCFTWYLTSVNHELSDAIGNFARELPCDEAREAHPARSRDPLKGLYHSLLPREVRHDLGEHYTPDWLAEHVLKEVGYEGQLDGRWLDPACGSGTFLVLAIERLKAACAQARLSKQESLATILSNIAGIDLNPLAALAARTNYLLALGDLREQHNHEIEIPVYLADSILAPPNIGQFDFIAGNPPWIGWESLPTDYREQTQRLWVRYGLFPHGGMDTILGKGKKDLSILMSYAVTDRLLKPGGKLGFLITQSVFKTSGSADGFRRFKVGEREDDRVRVLRVDDFTNLQPFAEASTRTAAFVWEKGSSTQYPVPYRVWQKTVQRRSIDQHATISEAIGMTRRLDFVAEPIDANNITSAWLTATPEALAAARRIVGRSSYQAHEGVNTGGNNGVYWVEVLEWTSRGTVIVRNITEGTKRPVEQITAELEPGLIYPLLRGREVQRWQADANAYVILAQDVQERRGIAELAMQNAYPRTYKYLQHFERDLRGRAAFKRYFTRQQNGATIESGPFYSMFNVGAYTLAPWKVVWHRMIAPLGAVVVGLKNGKPILPQETHVFVGTESAQEAFYLAGMLNSLPFNFAALAYSQAGGKSFGSPHLLEHLRVPTFEIANQEAVQIAELAKTIQFSISTLDADSIDTLECRLDESAAALWDISPASLAELQQALDMLTKTDLKSTSPAIDTCAENTRNYPPTSSPIPNTRATPMTDWLEAGAKAPAFTLAADDGKKVKLSDLKGSPVVLYFYPADDTPGCTKEACAFRDRKAELQKLGLRVFGISPDDVASHVKFRDKYQLNFPLLADPDHAVADKFGAWREKNMYGKKSMGVVRSTFLIDAKGIIRKVWKAVRVDGHDEAVLTAARELLGEA